MKKIDPIRDYVEETDEELNEGMSNDYPAFPKLFKGLIWATFIVGGMMLLFYCCK